jgi:hypothetical protein
MSAFTDFIQTELPLRPYLAVDVPQQSVLVRQGAGPRQMSGIQLNEGEILINIGGTLQAALLEDLTGSTDSYVHNQTPAATQWDIEHNMASENYILQVFDPTGKVMNPSDIETLDANNIRVTFPDFPTEGKAIMAVIRE